MTTTIRGKSGKSALRELLDQHDECVALIDLSKLMVEPMVVREVRDIEECSAMISITKEELVGILQARLQVINTKLENLGLKIGDEVENAQ